MTPNVTSAVQAADFPALRVLAEILSATAPLEVEESGDEESVTVYRCPICDGEGSVAADEVLTMNASPHDFPIGAVGIQCFGIGDGHGNLERALRDAPKEITALLAKLAAVEGERSQAVTDGQELWNNSQEALAAIALERDQALARAEQSEALLREADEAMRHAAALMITNGTCNGDGHWTYRALESALDRIAAHLTPKASP